jgi:hypothetical protein
MRSNGRRLRCAWRFLLMALLSYLPLAGWGALKWDNTELMFDTAPKQQEVTGEYHFTNVGAKELTIVKVSTSCGCTTAAPDKRIYQPGESGTIKATLHTKSMGLNSRNIFVETDDREEEVISLKISAMVHEYAKLTDYMLAWKIGDEPVPRKSTFEVIHDGPIKVVSATPNKEGFTVVLREITPGKRYEIEATPNSTADKLHAEVVVMTDWPPEDPLTYSLALAVSRRLTTTTEDGINATLAKIVGANTAITFSVVGVICLVAGIFLTRWLLLPKQPAPPSEPADPPKESS